jgi:integral membrane protein
VQGALTRYRIMAWIVGVVLIVLVLIGMPLKYLGDNDTVVATVGPAHGFLFMVYLVATFDLGRRAKWPLSRMLVVMLAGTIPFFSFWAERKVTRSWVGTARPALAE